MSSKHSCVTLLLSISTSALYFYYIEGTPDSFQCFMASPTKNVMYVLLCKKPVGDFFFFKVWFTTNNIKREKISTSLPLATKTKCLFDVKLRLLYSDMGLDLREHIHRIILH